MKKVFITILSVLMALSLFVSCSPDTTTDSGLLMDHMFAADGKYYSSLQEAVDALSTAKGLGDNVIRLIKDASGPGAVIKDLDVTIDFDGHSYAFTDVTGKYNKDYNPGDSIEGKFGLKITGSSNVTLKNISKPVTLNDKTKDLVMIFVEGSGSDETVFSKLTVEGKFDLTVQDNQYVFWGTNRANLFIGSEDVEDPNLIKFNGKLAAGGNTEGWILGKTTVKTAEIAVKDNAIIHLRTVKQEDGETGRIEIGTIIKHNNGMVVVESNAKVHIGSTEPGTVIINSNPEDAFISDVPSAVLVNTYSINYVLNGGTLKYVDSDKYYTHGQEKALPLDVEKANHIFDGWYDNAAFEGKAIWVISASESEAERGDKTYYAKWIDLNTKYTVTFNPNGGTVEPESIELKNGDKYGELPVPTRTGYTFAGWYSSLVGGDKIEETSEFVLYEDETIYARWNANTYLVTLNENGGTIVDDISSYTYGVGANLPTNITKSGYSFGGWFAKADLSGEPVTSISITDIGDKEFWAKWTENAPDVFSVTLVTNGGSITSGHEVTSYTEGTGATLPTSEFISRANYTFGGWFVDVECSGSAVTEITTSDTGDKLFYAKWTAESYSVTLNTNGGTIETGHEVTTYTYGTGAVLPTEEYISKTGNTFDGWYDNSACTGTAVTAISSSDSGAKTYYAKWIANTYAVTLNVNGGTINSGSISSYTYGIGANLPTNVTRSGYSFGGWFAKEDLSGEAVTSITTSDIGIKTFWAKWTANTYTVQFNAHNGGSNPDSILVTYGSKYGTLPVPTYGSKTFAGWYTAETGGSQITAESDVTITATQILHARWTTNSITVTFKANYPEGPTDRTQKPEKSVTFQIDPNVFTRTGYTFAGWAESSEGDVVYGDNESISGGFATDKTLYAKWNAISYTVTFKSNYNPETQTSTHVDFGSEYGDILPELIRAGYTFLGWFTESDGGTKIEASSIVSIADNHNLYAHWEAITYKVKFHSNYGTETTVDQTLTYDTGASLTPNTFSRTNYTFAGWTTVNDETYYENSQNVLNLSNVKNDVIDLYAQWVEDEKLNYVGKVVTSNASGKEEFITPVFYSQMPAVADSESSSYIENYNVKFNFYYSKTDGSLVRLYDVDSNEIKPGNGNTKKSATVSDDSTAYTINERLQKKTSVTENSVIYYEVIDPNSQYDTNKDEFASFYMYIPADSGENVYSIDGVAKSAGSSFSKVHYSTFVSYTVLTDDDYKNRGLRRDNYAPPQGGSVYANQPDTWVRVSWSNHRIINGSIGQANFSTGRTLYNNLITWIGSDDTKKGWYYGGMSTPETTWDLMNLANNENAQYNDWFIPAFGELEQMRLTFGDTEDAKNYFGNAVIGTGIFNVAVPGTSEGQGKYIMSCTNSDTTSGKWENYWNNGIYWKTFEDRVEGYMVNSSPAKPGLSFVLVRTF